MPFASVREIEIYYEIHGDGPRVLLISGTGETLANNRSRYQGSLVEQFEVLMYDQRGLGQTSQPDVEYTMADYADDAAELLRSVGWSRCHVVGVSFGGMVAQHLAIRHPDVVDRLVLACTTSGGRGGSSYDLLQLETLSPTERILRLLPILDSRNDPTAQPPRWAPGLESFFASAGTPLPDDPVQLAGFRRQLEARGRHDAWEQLPDIESSTLVIGGQYDLQAPPENVERLAQRIPGAQLTFCDGGHLFLWQDPGAWPEVIAFLSG
jgi:3-oxoadipate enol-lactonase